VGATVSSSNAFGKGPRLLRINNADSDEVFYIFDREMSFLLGDRIERASKGALVFIPRGYVHAVHVDSDEAHRLNLHTPKWVREIGGAGRYADQGEDASTGLVQGQGCGCRGAKQGYEQDWNACCLLWQIR
jgi:hypothetical protein